MRISGVFALLMAGASVLSAGCETSTGTQPMPQLNGPPNQPVGGAGSVAPSVAPPVINPGPSANVQPGTAGGPATTMNAAGSGAQTAPAPIGGQAGSGMPPATDPVAAGPAPYRAKIVVPQVAAGEEGTVCIQVRLDNAQPINVVRLHNKLSVASHHFIVSKVTDPTGGEEAIAPCVAFRGAIKGAPLTITQKKDDDVVLPQGVAYNFAASQVLHLELHYLNVGSDPVDVSAETELFAAPAGEQVQEATVMLIGTGDIAVAPHTTASTGAKYTELPREMDGVHFFAITGHTHRFGTDVNVSSAASADQAGTLLYAPQPFIWDAPEMVHFDPAVQVPVGGGFSFECEWNNPSDDVITFGESALAEMCFFWAYYYPKKDVTNVLLDGLDLGPFLGG